MPTGSGTGTTPTTGPPDNQAVHRALSALSILAESPTPLTGGEIGRRLGIHQTSASRLVRSLVAAGYAREIAGGFVPDLQMFSLASAAGESHPVVIRFHDTVVDISREWPQLDVTLVTLHRHRPLYFLRTLGGRPAPITTRHYPLHLSAASLRLLLEHPEPEALEALAQDAGAEWERPTTLTPATPEETLTRARRSLHGDSLVISGWLAPNHITGAIPIEIGEPTPFVLSLSSLATALPESDFLAALRETRARLENTP